MGSVQGCSLMTSLQASLALTLLLLFSCSATKSVVTYLGTDFILRDGCPLRACDQTDLQCNRDVRFRQEQYEACLQTENAQYIGCVTDPLPTGKLITVPVYANFCSAYCYESDPSSVLAALQPCPYDGLKQDVDPVLQRLF